VDHGEVASSGLAWEISVRSAWQVALGVLLGLLQVPVPLAAAQTIDFKDKRVEFIIPVFPGGGTDVWARFLQPYLEKYLPGPPTVVIKNQPGGNGIASMNQFQARALPDGLTVVGTTGSVQLPYMLDDPRVKYDFKGWTPLLVSPTGGITYVRPELGLTSPADIGKLKGQKMTFGSQGVSSLHMVAVLAYELLDLDLHVVFGLKGRAEGRLGFERGELNIDYQSSGAFVKNVAPLVLAGKAVPLFTWGVLDAQGNVVRDPSFPNLPSFVEAYEAMHGGKPKGVEWEVYKSFFAAGYAAQKILFLPKGTPEPIITVWRQAVAKAVGDPEFLARSRDELGDYEHVIGPEAAALTRIGTSIDPAAKDWVKNWLATKYSYKPGIN
jgi:tripartite-type tricarboxylate transporter receptor subunit TctC